MLEHLSSKPKFIAMDFEFDNIGSEHILSLGQIEIDKSIYIYDLRRFDKIQKAKYIDYLTHSNIKLLHGSESLDLKFMLEFMGRSNFDKFLDMVVDTRFLCEVYHILNKTHKFKCTIYSALFDVGAIDSKEYQILKSVRINYRQRWNIDKIDKIDKKRLTYAAKDVMFLKNLYMEYKKALGIEAIEAISNVYRRVFRIRLDEPSFKYDKYDLDDMEQIGIFELVVAKSNIGIITLRHLSKVDYFRKPLIWMYLNV